MNGGTAEQRHHDQARMLQDVMLVQIVWDRGYT